MENYGPRLSDREYERAVATLHSGESSTSTIGAKAYALDREELWLAVKHRLGSKYPKEKFESLWGAHQKLRKKRLLLLAASIASRIRAGSAVEAKIPARVAKAYAKAVGEDDARALLRLSKGEMSRLIGK